MLNYIYPCPYSYALYLQCLNTVFCETKVKRSLATTKNSDFFPKFCDNLAQCLARLTLPSTFYIICPPNLHVCDSRILNSRFWSIHQDWIRVYIGLHFSWPALDCRINPYHHCNLLQVRKVISSKKETYYQQWSDGYRGCQEYTWPFKWLREWIYEEE